MTVLFYYETAGARDTVSLIRPIEEFYNSHFEAVHAVGRASLQSAQFSCKDLCVHTNFIIAACTLVICVL